MKHATRRSCEGRKLGPSPFGICNEKAQQGEGAWSSPAVALWVKGGGAPLQHQTAAMSHSTAQHRGSEGLPSPETETEAQEHTLSRRQCRWQGLGGNWWVRGPRGLHRGDDVRELVVLGAVQDASEELEVAVLHGGHLQHQETQSKVLGTAAWLGRAAPGQRVQIPQTVLSSIALQLLSGGSLRSSPSLPPSLPFSPADKCST